MVASSAILSSYLPPLQLGTEKGGPTTPSISFPLGKRFARTRLSLVVKSTTNSDGEIDGDENKVLVKDDGDSSFKPFGFVNDNPSSRSAIQLPASPAEDGNVGEMLYRIEDKGKEFGFFIESGIYRWFVRETGSSETSRGTILFIHGAPTQSYSYRVVMSQMADSGFHCFAPDWIGFGFSDRPQPGYKFNYTEKEYHEELDKLLEVLNIKSPFCLVVQGFLVGTYGLTWALKNSSKISKLIVLNSPLSVSSSLPGLFKQLRFPLLGEFTCQNAIMAERFIEAGSAYSLKMEKADVYRLPYLSSGAPGFALLDATRKANFKDIYSRVAMGFSEGRWEKPMLVAWGLSDKYLPQSEAEEFKKTNPNFVNLKLIEGAGHMPQEDWPEKVVEALQEFL
ncbi:Hydrolase, alpha/beta fold family protein [Zostera marina]|uniref:Hydrolase, alpha/beta fold family protein n=1 Tax=Zostera marina TaxID=29655 RepID=A0A0K9Q6D2_ZOSMR|nr:Hydrolase, alpha/beta fold family protein [Zostera marina]